VSDANVNKCPICGETGAPFDAAFKDGRVLSGHGPEYEPAHDPHYLDYLERENAALTQRVADLEALLLTAEGLLNRYESWGKAALVGLDEVVARLLAEGHGPPPTPFRRAPHATT
jgi:hypothetical protein